MILIEIRNVDELVKQKKGQLASLIGSFVVDVEAEVEKAVIDQLKAAFGQNGIRANIVSMSGVNFRSFVFDLATEVERIGLAEEIS